MRSREKPSSDTSATLTSVITPSRWNTMPSTLASMNFDSRSSLSRSAASIRRWCEMSLISTNAPTSASLTTWGTRLTSIQRGAPSGPFILRSYDAASAWLSKRSTCGWISAAACDPTTSANVRPMIDTGSWPKVLAYCWLA